jgi:phosphatidate cytidylyltransferase
MLRTRVLSALVLVPVVLLALFISPLTTAILTGVASVIGTYEFYTMAKNSRYHFNPLYLPGYVLAVSFSLAGYLLRLDLIFLAIGLFAVYALLTLWIRHRFEPSLDEGPQGLAGNWGITVFAPIYAGLPLGLITLIRTRFDGRPDADWWILLALLGTWGTDTAAYFAGRAFGRHKLAPKISPNKTVEGAIGGLLVGTLAVALVGTLTLDVPLYLSIPLGLVLSAGSIFGDLFESWVKRRFGIKDSGKIIPGHGGLLDRIDSFLVVALLLEIFVTLYR